MPLTIEAGSRPCTHDERHEDDVAAWAAEQASFLRQGRPDLLNVAHLAEEIEDMGDNEQGALVDRMAVLLAHPLKWQMRSGRRSVSWQLTVPDQRRGVARRLDETPSRRCKLAGPDRWAGHASLH